MSLEGHQLYSNVIPKQYFEPQGKGEKVFQAKEHKSVPSGIIEGAGINRRSTSYHEPTDLRDQDLHPDGCKKPISRTSFSSSTIMLPCPKQQPSLFHRGHNHVPWG
ncbi:MAG TPA: hypothetical protein VMW09_04370 [Desulfatiglandales bacterium]|nr:hypothetical protein [Desulfatiglandales bacterium]